VKFLPVHNPRNRFASTTLEYDEQAPPAHLEVFEEQARSVISENDSPDVPMRFSVNPYRGCVHACAYCYARPSHQYLGFGAGTDFDRKIVVRVNAPEVLRATFDKRSWRGDSITFSGNTDCYQPLERSYELTRRCLEICADYKNPVHVITKSALVRRDVALLARLARVARCGVTISIPFADDDMARAIEPYASAPSARFETVRVLAEAGLSVGVNIAPVIPGLNDPQIAEILERARAAGACEAGLSPVRLAAEVLPVFLERLEAAYPARLSKVKSAIAQVRGGRLNQSAFGRRMEGEGPRWQAISALFEAHRRRLGFGRFEGDGEASDGDAQGSTFARPSAQRSLFQ
jgi:DNA repair photolyase